MISHAVATLALVLPAPAPAAQGNSFQRKADEFLSGLAREGKFSGWASVSQNGKVLFEKSYGKANIELNVPFRRETRFRIHSLSKQMTAAVLMRLVEQGRLAPSDPVSKYLPEWPAAWSSVSLEHLLTHTSGLSISEREWLDTWTAGPYETLKKGLPKWGEKPLATAPGEKWQYSNLGYEVLAAVLQRVTGQSFPDLMDSLLFRPHNLKESAIDLPGPSKQYDASRLLPSMASGYNGDPANVQTYLCNSYMIMGSGGVWSTVGDMRRYCEALLSGKVVSPASLEKMWQGIDIPGSPSRYGYGWVVGERHGRPVVRHDGGNNGFLSFVEIYPKDKVVVITMNNIGYGSMEAARTLSGMLFGVESKPGS